MGEPAFFMTCKKCDKDVTGQYVWLLKDDTVLCEECRTDEIVKGLTRWIK